MYKAIKSNGDIKEVRHKDEIIWKLYTKPKVFIFGDVSGITLSRMEACIKTTEYEIVGKNTYGSVFFQGIVDLKDQQAVFDAYKVDKNIIIILGFDKSEICDVFAETFKDGDPTFAGPLSGKALGLKTYHITESEIKNKCDPKAYKDNIELFESLIEIEDIHNTLKSMRDE